MYACMHAWMDGCLDVWMYACILEHKSEISVTYVKNAPVLLQAAGLPYRTLDCTKRTEAPQILLQADVPQYLVESEGADGRQKVVTYIMYPPPSETAAGATSTPSRSQSWRGRQINICTISRYPNKPRGPEE